MTVGTSVAWILCFSPAFHHLLVHLLFSWRKMAKHMRFDWASWSLSKHNHIWIKIGVSLLLMGLAFRLFVSHSVVVPPVAETSFVEQASPAQTPVSSKDLDVEGQESEKDKCDIFTGEWIPNPTGPVYNNVSCRVIQGHQNCMMNGRPDTKYLYWRWKPLDCELPVFDPLKFLNSMRNKSWGFIGDSISRNHVQSLLCLLSQVEDAIDVYHDKNYQNRKWHFPSYNFTLSVIWSPFLVKAAIFEDINGVSTSDIQLHLDSLDTNWTRQLPTFDYVVIGGGKWFLKTAIYYENNTIIGCHYCPGKNLTEFGFENAYSKALQLVMNFIIETDYKGTVLFRTSTPDHFENGEWFNGGTCKRTMPYKEGEISVSVVDKMFHEVELEQIEKAKDIASERGVALKLLDTTQLSLLRPDGHPGPYRQYHPFAEDRNAQVQNDCLHWCLPGPIDSWNDLVMEMVQNSQENLGT